MTKNYDSMRKIVLIISNFIFYGQNLGAGGIFLFNIFH